MTCVSKQTSLDDAITIKKTWGTELSNQSFLPWISWIFPFLQCSSHSALWYSCHTSERINVLNINTQGSQRLSESDSLQPPDPSARPRRRGAWKGFTENCWLINCLYQTGLTATAGQSDLPRFTLSEGSFGFCIHDDASSFAPSMQLAFLPLNSLGWMENDNPLTVDSSKANWLITAWRPGWCLEVWHAGDDAQGCWVGYWLKESQRGSCLQGKDFGRFFQYPLSLLFLLRFVSSSIYILPPHLLLPLVSFSLLPCYQHYSVI